MKQITKLAFLLVASTAPAVAQPTEPPPDATTPAEPDEPTPVLPAPVPSEPEKTPAPVPPTATVEKKVDKSAEPVLEAKAKERSSWFKVPDWVTGVQDHSDLRLRFDEIHAPDGNYVTRIRYRPRLRLGAIATFKDDFEIGFRLASAPTVGRDSGGDPLSTNQNFEDNGSRKPVGVDWSFVRWTPLHTHAVTGSIAVGKLENPPNFTEDVFDVDYTPEGAAEVVAVRFHPNHTANFYFGQYILDELAASPNDPFLLVEQLRLDSKWCKQVTTAFTASALSIGHPRSLTTANVPDSNHGNTRDASGALTNDYQVLIGDASVTFNLDSVPTYNGPFPIKLYGEYIHNLGADNNNTAYSIGPSFGSVGQRNSQIGNAQKGNWELSYRYQRLEGDSTYEELTASDNGAFYRSNPVNEPASASFKPTFLNGLNLRGHAFRLAYAPFDFMVIDLRVWRNEAINVANESERVKGTRVLFDLVWRF